MNSLAATMQLFSGYKRFPNDNEFIREIKIKDLYNFRSKTYFLSKIENYKRKEPVSIGEFTIEHIMPQNENLNPEWQQMLGVKWKEIQSTWLHTLGNLTLTAYNSELSDHSFQKKKIIEGGFNHSPLNLNDYMRNVEEWNEVHIQQRAEQLAQIASTIWQYPNMPKGTIKKYTEAERKQANEYTLAHYEHLSGEMFQIFEELRKRILELDESVKEEFKKLYIAYKTSTNFVDIVPQKSRLRLSLNMPFTEIIDPDNICKDITDLGRWGNGDVEVGVVSIADIPKVMGLVQQAMDYQDQ
jgi:predicted transport protein